MSLAAYFATGGVNNGGTKAINGVIEDLLPPLPRRRGRGLGRVVDTGDINVLVNVVNNSRSRSGDAWARREFILATRVIWL